jgi:hypothetical protein
MPTWNTKVSATASSVCAGTVVHRSAAALKRFPIVQVETRAARHPPAGNRGLDGHRHPESIDQPLTHATSVTG